MLDLRLGERFRGVGQSINSWVENLPIGQIRLSQKELEDVDPRGPTQVKSSWALFKTGDLNLALKTAKDYQRKGKSIQLRQELVGESWEYIIEPKEPDCGCPGLIKLPKGEGS